MTTATKADWIKLADLTFDDRLQMREKHVETEEYEELLKGSKASEWPFNTPMVAAECEHPEKEGETCKFVVSGFTRGWAAQNLNRRKVMCQVVKVDSWQAAIEMAAGENVTHGYRRKPGDLRKAIQSVVALGRNNTETAEICKCHVRTVTLYKADNQKSKKHQDAKKEGDARKKRSKDVELVSLEQCPVCGSNAWRPIKTGDSEEAQYECSICKHAYGETPGGDGEENVVYEDVETTTEATEDAPAKKDATPEENFKLLKGKAVSLVEQLARAVGDMQDLKKQDDSEKECIDACKTIHRLVKAWKFK